MGTKKNGKLAVKASMRDIARIAGISTATVSRAMRGSPLVTEETRESVLRVAADHGYVVNRNARKLRQQRSNTVAVVVDFQSLPSGRLSEPFHFQLLADLANALGTRDQDLLLCAPAVELEHTYHLMLASKGADGIIFLGEGGRDPAFRQLARLDAPFVVWGAPARGKPYCCIGSDNANGGEIAARRFISLGRERPLFVGLGDEHLEIRHRWEGFRKEWRQAGYAPPRRIVLADLSFESASESIDAWLGKNAEWPDAIFAATDTIALAALAVLRRRGTTVPGEVSVIGFDDVAQASYNSPALTTVRQDTGRASVLLVEALLAAIDGKKPRPASVSVELIVRET